MGALFGLLMLVLLFPPGMAQAQDLKASWYSLASLKEEGTYKTSQGIMANGRRFKDEDYTAASWDYKIGQKVKVINQENGKAVIVEITDRTARRFKGKRIDLSREAFKVLTPLSKGIVKVSVERVD